MLAHRNIITSFIAVFAMIAGCRSNHLPSLSTGGVDYVQVNLIADTIGYNATRADTNLDNPWGIAISPKGSVWIACNHSALSVIYDINGIQTLAPVGIARNGVHYGASPTGVVYNGTSDFIANGKVPRFIYASEEGTISGWISGDSTITLADRSSVAAIYKGIAIANDGTGNFIYAADFFNNRIDVFDGSFNLVTNKPFSDPAMPAGFAPFNIRNINGNLFVLYAKQKVPDNEEDEKGPGNGYINIFAPNGKLVKSYASQGSLNSPWGITQPPKEFGLPGNTLLVANFGDGRVNVFDSTGALIGPLENNGIPIVINGLWDVAFSATDNTRLFFTAGPGDEQYGLFGYLKTR
jgi:uncharacterized protein (TIGR03118 family)